ncbi:MAG: hypothetical protein WCE62_17500 [Polyangiales bacterium]
MKRTAAALALGVILGMGIGPALAGAYSADPAQDTTRALEEIAKTLKSQDNTRALQEISRTLSSQDTTRALDGIAQTLRSIDSTLSRCQR